MSIVQLTENLKDLSKDQLVSEAKRPSGMAPPYLIIGELQRRNRMESALNASQNAQQPQTTVAQDVVNAAGVPQQGLAQMAQALAPKTDMAQNTARQPTTMMAGGTNKYTVGEKLSKDWNDFLSWLNPEYGPDIPAYMPPGLVPMQTRSELGPTDPNRRSDMTAVERRSAPLEAVKRMSRAYGGLQAVSPSVAPTMPDVPEYTPPVLRRSRPTVSEYASDLTAPSYIPAGATELNLPVVRNALSGSADAGLATGLKARAEAGPMQGLSQPNWGTMPYYRAILADPNSSAAEKVYAQQQIDITEGVKELARDTVSAVGDAGKWLWDKAGIEPAPWESKVVEGFTGLFSPDLAGQMIWDRQRNERIADEDAAMAMPVKPAEAVQESPGAETKPTEERKEFENTTPDPSLVSSVASGSTGSSISASLSQMGQMAAGNNDKIMEEFAKDKWLALARAGAAIMMTPNVGMSAIGAGVMAGLEGLAMAKQNRDAALEAQNAQAMEQARLALAQRAAAARGAGGGGGFKEFTTSDLNHMVERMYSLKEELDFIAPGGDTSKLSPEQKAQYDTLASAYMQAVTDYRLAYTLRNSARGLGTITQAYEDGDEEVIRVPG